jgi:peptidoglycan/LPS O-acetylase OafA/YrhL
MQTSTRNFGLDLLRAAAIFAVVLFHAAPTLDLPRVVQAVAAHGWIGVDLFFVLSGYLIGLQVFSAHPRSSAPFLTRCSGFWIKRWTRTIPLYAVVLCAYVFLKPRLFHAEYAGFFNWKWLFFLQNYGDVQDFGQSWSLCIEEQFYFVFPVIAFSIAVLPRIVWLLPLVLSMAFRFWTASHLADPATGLVQLTQHDYLRIFRFSTPAMLDAISIGVFLASHRSTWSAWRASIRLAFAPLGLLLVLAKVLFTPTLPTSPLQIAYTYTLLALGFGALLIAAEQWQRMPTGLSLVRWIALCSYSSYLLHEMYTKLFFHYGQGPRWILHTVVYFTVFAGISVASYELIEKPGMRLRTLLGGRAAAKRTGQA